MESSEIGSVWHKWDMHIHTPETRINNQYKKPGKTVDEIWQDYCSQLNNSQINAFGIADYGSFENYINLKENRYKYKLSKDIYIFPNLELRVSGLTPNMDKKGKSNHSKVNIHILLSDKVSDHNLHKLLEKIQVNGPNGTKLDFKNDYDKIVSKKKFNYIPSYKEVMDALKQVFGNNSDDYLIMLPNKGDGIATDVGTGDQDDFTFINDYVDIIQSSSTSDREFYLKKHNKNSFNRLFPCVKGSDTHDFENLSKLRNEECTWIKSTLSFDGLRSILFEPEDRVIVQNENPDNKISSKQVKVIQMPEKSFKKQKIFFSKGLVSIIGSRSSGKSLLLSILARTMGYDKKIKENNEEYQSMVNDYSRGAITYYYDNQEANTNTKSVDLIYQNQLQSIAMSQEKINKFVNNILTGQNIEEKTELDKKLKIKRNSLNIVFGDLKNKKRQLNEIKSKVIKFQNEEKIKENMEELERKISSLEVKYDKNKVADLNGKIIGLGERKQVLIDTNDLLIQLPQKLINDVPDELLSNQFSTTIKNLVEKFRQEISTNVNKEINKNNNEIKCIEQEIHRIKKDKDFKIFQESMDKTPQLNQLNDALDKEREELKELRSLNEKKGQLKDDFDNSLEELRDLLTISDYQKEILSTENLSFKYELNFDLGKVREIFINNLRTSRNLYKAEAIGIMTELDDENTNINFEKAVNDFCDTVINIVSQDDDFDAFRAKKDVYTLLNDLKNTELFKYNYVIFYKNKDFNKMSEGKKAFVLLLLKLKLEKNDMPLLIDQPEDELDNKSIVNDLVLLLRNQKKYRQIILVTHNANIVIGADSEQVIIASEKDEDNLQEEKFYYEGGPLEDGKVKNKICEILEGGKNAFKKRENRYDFKF